MSVSSRSPLYSRWSVEQEILIQTKPAHSTAHLCDCHSHEEASVAGTLKISSTASAYSHMQHLADAMSLCRQRIFKDSLPRNRGHKSCKAQLKKTVNMQALGLLVLP